MIGRLFGRKSNDNEAARSADRLITSRDAKPVVPSDARANDARIDAALEAAVDTGSLSRVAQALPTAASAPAHLSESAAPNASASAPADHLGAAASSRHSFGEGGRDLAAPEDRSAPGVPHAPLAPDASDPWLADAFDRLLVEEQGEAPAESYGGGYSLSEGDLDRIAGRVADRLTRGALGETVTRIVTDVSERLVREEIQRIRQSALPPSDHRS